MRLTHALKHRWKMWRRRRYCFHHDNRTGESWVGHGVIVDYRKLYMCAHCEKIWIL